MLQSFFRTLFFTHLASFTSQTVSEKTQEIKCSRKVVEYSGCCSIAAVPVGGGGSVHAAHEVHGSELVEGN